jgi:hypothetical protein
MLGTANLARHLCTKKKSEKGVGIKSMGTRPTYEQEMDGGVGIELEKPNLCTKRRWKGRKNWVGDENLVCENLTHKKEMEGGRGRGFLGWCHMKEANLGFIKPLGFDNQTCFANF